VSRVGSIPCKDSLLFAGLVYSKAASGYDLCLSGPLVRGGLDHYFRCWLGATSVAAFAVLSAWAFPFLGVFLGVVFSWVASAVLITIPSVLWLRRMTARELLDKEKR